MTITPDTNILVRAVLPDSSPQSAAAIQLLRQSERIALSITSLCELVWVLRSGYKLRSTDIAEALHQLVNARNVFVDHSAFEAGLIFVQNNGDFADGVIAHEGRAIGATTFASFDKRAVSLLASQGHSAKLLS